jgi:hypothetical protein
MLEGGGKGVILTSSLKPQGVRLLIDKPLLRKDSGFC